MRRMFTPFAVLLFLLVTSKTYSQIVYTFNDSMAVPSANSYPNVTASAMTSENNTLPTSGIPPTTVTRTSASRGYDNYSGTFNLGAAADTGRLRRDSSAYFEFTITNSGSDISVSSLGFALRSTSTGPQKFAVRYSLDAFTSNLATDTLTNTSTWVAKNFTGLNIPVVSGLPVIMRIYGYDGSGNRSAGTVNWRIDDVTINGNGVLPVALSNFTASVINNKVQLNWASANEVNLKGYSVERSSDNKNFSEVSYVAATGKGNYSAQDAVSSSAVFYRLKLVSQDGSFTYSKSIPVNASLAGSAALRVFPNPVVNSAIIAHPQAGTNASLKVTDLNGRVLQSNSVQQGAIQTTININKLMSGTYLLVYRDASGKVASTRLIKQ